MKVTRLGQAGLLFVSGGTAVLVDPYFTDSAFAVSGVHRRSEAPAWVWDIKPDAVLITHDHIDHYDPETFSHFVNEKTAVTVLSPRSVWEKARLQGGGNNFVLVSPGVQWTCGGVAVKTVKAFHSDPYAVGFVLEAEGKTVYITGDTLYNPEAFKGAPAPFAADYVFLPINGRGNNMNAGDAALLAAACRAKHAVPVHYGMLDDISPQSFVSPAKKVMNDYTEYEI
ncbi:MAG: MBL fold metallo-hydrolase [Clostridia bacterium]|nr:MBL fold metallo-hydrolase [Clostridia bacterium]